MKPRSLKSTASKLTQARAKLALAWRKIYAHIEPKARHIYGTIDEVIKGFCTRASTYITTLIHTLLAKTLAQRNALITLGLLFVSVCFGLWSVFVLGILYERAQSSLRASLLESNALVATPKPPIESPRIAPSTPPKSHIGMGDSLQALSTKPPAIPALDEKESVITGSLTYTNAISIARSSLMAQDFTRARIWLYRAFLLHNGAQEVWELYWQSFEQDYRASIEQKQAAYTLYLQAKRYYGF